MVICFVVKPSINRQDISCMVNEGITLQRRKRSQLKSSSIAFILNIDSLLSLPISLVLISSKQVHSTGSKTDMRYRNKAIISPPWERDISF